MSKFTISGFSDEIHQDIDKQFQHLNKLGIEYFEPRGVNGKNIAALNIEETKELKHQMDNYNIKASSIGSPIGKITLEEDMNGHLDLLKRVIDIAKILDTTNIRVFSFFITDGDYSKHKTEVLERMNLMTELAEKEGVVLLHENEKGIYGDIASRCVELFEEIKCPNLGCVFDPANFVQCGQETFSQCYELLKPYITYMHIKDALKDGTVVPAGYGVGYVKEILLDLYKNGYDGFLSLEPHLGSFSGLENLELSDDMLKLAKSTPDSFTLAYNALKTIIDDIK